MGFRKQLCYGALVATILFACSAGVFVWSGHSPLKRGPTLEVTPESIELKTRDTATQQFTFSVKNVGDSDLEISDIVPLCQCTILSETKATIAPGGTWELKLDVRPPGVGQRTSGVEIHSTCVKSPVKRLSVIIGRQTDAPFVLRGPGALNIVSVADSDEATFFEVKTVERVHDAKWITQCRLVNLPFAEIEQVSYSDDPYGGGEYVERIYKYRVDIKGIVPEGSSGGFVQLLSEDATQGENVILNVVAGLDGEAQAVGGAAFVATQ
jgi:hypothetical protein